MKLKLMSLGMRLDHEPGNEADEPGNETDEPGNEADEPGNEASGYQHDQDLHVMEET